MPKITIDLTESADKKAKMYMVDHCLVRKEDAINMIIENAVKLPTEPIKARNLYREHEETYGREISDLNLEEE